MCQKYLQTNEIICGYYYIIIVDSITEYKFIIPGLSIYISSAIEIQRVWVIEMNRIRFVQMCTNLVSVRF